MIGLHLPTFAGWICAVAGLLFVVSSAHGMAAPRPWLEWVERRFAYVVRMRFVGGALLLLAGGSLFFLPADGTLIAKLALAGLTILCIVAVGLLALQDHLRHLLIATAEQNDIVVRIIASLITLAGIAMLVLPFLK